MKKLNCQNFFTQQEFCFSLNESRICNSLTSLYMQVHLLKIPMKIKKLLCDFRQIIASLKIVFLENHLSQRYENQEHLLAGFKTCLSWLRPRSPRSSSTNRWGYVSPSPKLENIGSRKAYEYNSIKKKFIFHSQYSTFV